MDIITLTDREANDYTRFLLESEHSLFFQSDTFRKLIKKYTEEADKYLLALENNRIISALPLFIKQSPLGNCINSLPFFGSNGGIIEYNNDLHVKKALIKELHKVAMENKCVSATIITSPFENNYALYKNVLEFDREVIRVGQITTLHEPNTLLDSFHYKTRNSIKKALKSNLKVEVDNSQEAFDFLISEHIVGMQKIEANAKNAIFFMNVINLCKAGLDYNIYVASQDNNKISALLLFYFNKTVEYFTPVTKEEFRTLQPMSLLICKAMNDAFCNGYKYWNWGGTQTWQTGVYNFKKRWGTKNYNYHYLTKIYDVKIKKYSRNEIAENYPYFFLLPFDSLDECVN